MEHGQSETRPAPGSNPDAVRAALRRFPKVLVVDDSPSLVEILATFFTMDGFKVTTACGGNNAVNAIVDDMPDIAFIDLAMPDVGGLEVARTIRRRKLEPQPVLVALSGWDEPDQQREARDAGFDHFISKPVAPQTIRDFMQSLAGTDAGLAGA